MKSERGGRGCGPVSSSSLRRHLLAASAAILLAPALARSAARDDPRPENAVTAIMSVFARVPIVALGMSHRQQDEADFSLALIRDPRFAATVNDIVVECGNALYQATLDRYIEGGDVPLESLQHVWRDTTQPGACDPRQHKELLDAVRDLNLHRPPGQRLRVLAGDPPIDWNAIRTAEDLAPFMTQRDTHFASVVEKEVLARHRKALLVIGAGHVWRRPVSWAAVKTPPAPTITALIESRRPGSTFIVIPHDDFGARNRELEPRLSGWPVPSLAALRGNWLGALDARVVVQGKIRRVGTDPASDEDPFPGSKLQDIADAYLYLGPIASIQAVEFPHETGTPYARELDRRRGLEGGGIQAIAPAPIPAPPTHG